MHFSSITATEVLLLYQTLKQVCSSLIANKQSYNSNLTQIEFLVLMGRF